MVYILDIVHNFLVRPYRSVKEPLDLLFAATAGQNVDDWSLVHSVGMGKSSACRIILEVVVRLQLTNEEVISIKDELQALLRMKAVYDPADSPEEQLQRSFGNKARVVERPRPDPLQMASKWSQVLGLQFAAKIDHQIKAFNKDKTAGVQISDAEKAFIKMFVHQSKEFIILLEYHWQNFKVHESAVPLKVWLSSDLSPITKPTSRVDSGNELWRKILTWSPEKNYYWLLRCPLLAFAVMYVVRLFRCLCHLCEAFTHSSAS